MIEDKNIPHVLNQARPTLSESEKNSIWSSVEASLPPAQPILSPYSFTIFKQRYIMAPIALLLAIILGGGATAYASDDAKPGDALFAVEQLVESVQLGLTFSPEAKERLVESLMQERITELREIIDEEVSISPSNSDGSSATSSEVASPVVLDDLEIEARVFTDTTVVKLELGDKKFYFETDARDQPSVIDAVLVNFPVLSDILATTTDSASFLTFQVAGRESRPNDRGIVSLSQEGQDRINVAVDALLTFLDKTAVDGDVKDIAVASLDAEVDGITPKVVAVRNEDELRISDEDDRVVITVDDNGNSSVEVRSETASVKVEEEDGEVTVEKEKMRDDEEVEGEDENENAKADDDEEHKNDDSDSSYKDEDEDEGADYEHRDDDEDEDENEYEDEEEYQGNNYSNDDADKYEDYGNTAEIQVEDDLEDSEDDEEDDDDEEEEEDEDDDEEDREDED